MSLIEIVVLSIVLGMDTLAISICNGLNFKKFLLKNVLFFAICLAVFHGVFLLLGYFLGSTIDTIISSVDHWIAFALLLLVGLNMIIESFDGKKKKDNMDLKTLAILGIATSIDAFAVGVTQAFLDVNIMVACPILVIIIFLISIIGSTIGFKFAKINGKYATIVGGIILIILGTKILLEHLNII